MGLRVFCGELSNSVFFNDNACCLSEYQSSNTCAHVCDISYAACYCEIQMAERISLSVTLKAVGKCLERACIHSCSSCPWWSLVKFLLFDHESLTKQHLLKEINESRNISYNYCWIIIG